MKWIKDQYHTTLINLSHIRSIELKDASVIAVYGEYTEGEDDEDGEPLYQRFLLFESQEQEDAIDFLLKLAKKLNAIEH